MIRSTPSPKFSSPPLVLSFALESHATLLGLFSAVGTIHFPAVLHIPHHGTFRITTATQRVSLGYDAVNAEDRFIRVSLPAAQDAPIEYRFDVTTIYPDAGKASIENDPRYDAYRRDFQLRRPSSNLPVLESSGRLALHALEWRR